MQLPHQNFD